MAEVPPPKRDAAAASEDEQTTKKQKTEGGTGLKRADGTPTELLRAVASHRRHLFSRLRDLVEDLVALIDTALLPRARAARNGDAARSHAPCCPRGRGTFAVGAPDRKGPARAPLPLLATPAARRQTPRAPEPSCYRHQPRRYRHQPRRLRRRPQSAAKCERWLA